MIPGGIIATLLLNPIAAAIRDVFFKNVSLLLNGESANAAEASTSGIYDASPNNIQITPYNQTRNSAFTPFQSVGTYSVSLNGTTDTLSTPTNANFAATGDFTIEAWVYPTSNPDNRDIISNYVSNVETDWTLLLTSNSGGQVNFYKASATSWIAAPVTLNRWSHVAVVRSAGTVKIYVNGVVGQSAAFPGTFGDSKTIRIGSRNGAAGFFPGYISNLRYVNNTAIYTSNFTPPTAPLTAIPGTVLLTCQDAFFKDNSTNALALTATGTPSVSQQAPFSSPASTNGSLYFDGVADYLQSTTSPSLMLNSNQFSLEAWVYPIAYPAVNPAAVISNCNASNNGAAIYVTVAGKLQAGGRSNMLMTSTQNVPLKQWSHVAFTRDAADNVKLFLNGVLVGSNVATGWGFTHSQAAVGGGSGGGYNFNGYISNARITTKQLYSAAFTPLSAPLTAIPGTALLTCQSSTPFNNVSVLDKSPNGFIITKTGKPQPSAISPYSNRGFSGSFYGQTTSGVVTPSTGNPTLNGDFTIELWIFDNYSGSGNVGNTPWALNINSNLSSMRIAFYNASTDFYIAGTNIAINNERKVWNNYAIARSGSTIRVFKNGVIVSTVTSSAQLGVATDSMTIGARGDSNTTPNALVGYISNLRIIDGDCLYTDNYTPSFADLPVTANTKLLLFRSTDRNIVDGSNAAVPLTINSGGAGVSNVTPFSPGLEYSSSVNGGSAYFGATPDTLTVPMSSAFSFPGDYTIEFWFNPALVTGNQGLVINYQGATSTDWKIFLASASLQFWPSNTTNAIGTDTTIKANNWYHVSAVRSGSTCILYVNGVSVGTSTVAGTIGSPSKVITIGGSGPGTSNVVAFKGYISGLIINNKTALRTANFTPPTAPPTAVTGTSLCLNFADAGVHDVSGRSRIQTLPNLATTSSSKSVVPYVNYGFIALFNGGNQTVESASAINPLNTDVFTIEFYIKPTSSGSNGAYWIFNQNGLQVRWSGVTSWGVYVAGVLKVSTTTYPLTNSWSHIAIVREGKGTNQTKLYVNGVLAAGGTGTMSDTFGPDIIKFGTAQAGGSNGMTGYLSNIRFTKNVARYTSNFAVPAPNFSSNVNTSLLALAAPSYSKDISPNDSVFTTNISGSASAGVGSFPSLSGYGVSLSGNGSKAIYFPAINPVSNDAFTIEFWIRPGASAAANAYWLYSTTGINVSWVSTTRWGIGKAGTPNMLSTATLPVQNVWSHIAIVREGIGTDQTALYINGVLAARGTFAEQFSSVGDFYIGASNAASGYTGYISNVRIVNGTAVYTTGFTPTSPVITSEVITNTSLLALAGPSVTSDLSSNKYIATVIAGATLDTTTFPIPVNTVESGVSAGSNAIMIPSSTSGYLQVTPVGPELAFASADFTIEMNIMFIVADTQKILYDARPGSTNGSYVLLYIGADGTLRLLTTSNDRIIGTSTLLPNVYYHVALSRSAGVTRIFLNGVQEGAAYSDTNVYLNGSTDANPRPLLGANGYGLTNYFSGYMDNVRVTSGIGRYVNRFTPPTILPRN